MKNVLITGGAGFIGYHLARAHADRGDTVFIFDNFLKTKGSISEEFTSFINRKNVTFKKVDLTTPLIDVGTMPVLDVVYHLAAVNGTRFFYEIPYAVSRTNLLVTLNLLNWLEQQTVRRLLYASTSEIYADCEQVGLLKIPSNETLPAVFTQPTKVRFSYALSKFMGEFLCLQFGKTQQIQTSVVRYHNVYGPHMGENHVISEFIQRLNEGENPLRVYGADETRAFCYIDDAVEATLAVANCEQAENEIVHIGNSEEEISSAHLAELLIALKKMKCSIQGEQGREGSVSRRCPDTTKLFELTGIKAKIGLKEGLRRTNSWFEENTRLDSELQRVENDRT